MASSSNSKGKAVCSAFAEHLSPLFYDNLRRLQEEFEVLTNTKSTQSPHRFNIYLKSLESVFELMTLEIEALQKERDNCKAEVRQGKVVHPNSVCERCSRGAATTGTHKTVLSQLKARKGAYSLTARHAFQRKLLQQSGKYVPWRGVIQSQIGATNHRLLTRRMTLIRKLQTPVTACFRTRSRSWNNTASSQTITLSSSLSRLSTSTIDSNLGPEERARSIAFNQDVEKQLDVEAVHALLHGKAVFCVNFSQDGKYLAAGCEDGKAYIYDAQTGILMCVLRNLLAERDRMRVVRFSRDGRYLATGSWDGRLYIWEINTKYVRNAFKGHTRWILSLDFAPNGRLLVSTSYDNTVRLWDMRDGNAKFLREDNPTFLDSPCYPSAIFSPDGRYVAASHRDGIVRIWDIRLGQLLRRLKSDTRIQYHAEFMPDGEGLVSGGYDTTLRYWDISSLDSTRFRTTSNRHCSGVEEHTRPVRLFLGHKDSVHTLTISPDGGWVASCSRDKSIRIWDTQNGTVQCILNYDHQVLSIDFSPSGCYLVSGGSDGLVKTWRYSPIIPEVVK